MPGVEGVVQGVWGNGIQSYERSETRRKWNLISESKWKMVEFNMSVMADVMNAFLVPKKRTMSGKIFPPRS